MRVLGHPVEAASPQPSPLVPHHRAHSRFWPSTASVPSCRRGIVRRHAHENCGPAAEGAGPVEIDVMVARGSGVKKDRGVSDRRPTHASLSAGTLSRYACRALSPGGQPVPRDAYG
jgi:hypothetical protein